MDRKEKVLLKLCQKDPDKGVSLLVEEYHSAVKSICGHILQGYGSSNVEDAIQESFVRIWKFFKDRPAIEKSVKAYVYQIARNCALDQIRRQKSQADLSLEAMEYESIEELIGQTAVGLEEEFARNYNYRLVHEAIERMEEPNRSLFLLKFFYGYSVRQAAKELGLAEDNAESRIRRERKKLKKMLQQNGM